ncbi:MAG: transaldolase [Planctomycetes bacterium]|nr:transaldolase [Planctomycetota bacterium]
MTTATIRAGSKLSEEVHDFVRRDFTPHYGRRRTEFESDELWRQLADLGTELWLDSGNFDEVRTVWTREFSALTTNNSLLNQEVQTGTYDDLIVQAADLLGGYADLTEHEFMLEMAFILNASHGLRLVEQSDAYVSVEEHTDLAHDQDRAVEYARRYYAICPERFYVKIPFTPAGLLATRRARLENIPINHTLGFSARQNYVIARLTQPNFVNVFLGRLNSFISQNGLGTGDYVGERATLASQQAIHSLRAGRGFGTRQIGASFRSWEQYVNLAGIDVITAPPNVAREFHARKDQLPPLEDQLGQNRAPGINDDVDPEEIGLDTLWYVNDEVVRCVDALGDEDLDAFDAEGLVDFFEARGGSDFLVRWSNGEIATSAAEGKIPQLRNWADALADRTIGLDSLMNLAGLNTFAADQKKMDDHVRAVLDRTGARR